LEVITDKISFRRCDTFTCSECKKIVQPPVPLPISSSALAGLDVLVMILSEKFAHARHRLTLRAYDMPHKGLDLNLSIVDNQV